MGGDFTCQSRSELDWYNQRPYSSLQFKFDSTEDLTSQLDEHPSMFTDITVSLDVGKVN